MCDVGPHPLHVRFVYSVSDLHGNFDVDQTFDITVLPVNNQVERVQIFKVQTFSGFISIQEAKVSLV